MQIANHEMCLIHKDFKHPPASKANNFSFRGKVSSIMSAKVLSIMHADAGPVTSD